MNGPDSRGRPRRRETAPAETLPVFVRESDLLALGLSGADARRIMRLAWPIVKIPGSRSTYVKRDAVRRVLDECTHATEADALRAHTQHLKQQGRTR